MSIVASLSIPTSEHQQQIQQQQHQQQHDQNAIYVQKYYEHPLTAVTSAMLNMSAPVSESNTDNGIVTTATLNNNIQIASSHQLQQIQNSNGSSYIYEYYKVPDKDGLQWRYVMFL